MAPMVRITCPRLAAIQTHGRTPRKNPGVYVVVGGVARLPTWACFDIYLDVDHTTFQSQPLHMCLRGSGQMALGRSSTLQKVIPQTTRNQER
ncbi:hypothetical protein EYF80_022362 [Liparis tanakae]|uniref:Uncharacterized protein n=1 Tax=Liparis tanakae TaxID=230148 RepID=A0A4Z2HNS2_9TELE|nr:hypothetical protein EYF80_022362 [Liparis tanakae]